jgi:hypothetical protein
MSGRARDLALLAPASVTLAVLFGGALAGIVHASLVPLGGGVELAASRELLADPASLCWRCRCSSRPMPSAPD